MKFTKMFLSAFLAIVSLAVVRSEEETTYLYKHTRICSNDKASLCLAYNAASGLLVLDKRRKLKFDIEKVPRLNMNINRVYTFAKDQATRTTVKSCLISTNIEGSEDMGVALAPCDTDERELVLTLDTPDASMGKIKLDEFVLREIRSIENGSTESSGLCVSASEVSRKSPLLLKACDTGATIQAFTARGFQKSTSARIAPVAEVEAQIGRFCLDDQPELCLGVSLENGTTLVSDVFVQVKNFTKNQAKDLHDLKMRWYHDLENNRVASAEKIDYCMEAIYGAPIGSNRAGVPRYDDILHLGECGTGRSAHLGADIAGLPASEVFYTKKVTTPTSSYLELRTDVPAEAGLNSTTKCVSIVKCVKHENDHCTKYNSVEVYDAEDLQQGAYARLKDCNSHELVSQRFYYVVDDEITVPPTNFPTPKPQTASPTQSTPTAPPTPITEPIPPTPDTDDSGSSDDPPPIVKKENTGLKAGLAFVGILCFAIILVALAYYYKNRGEFQGLPEEDENFIARV